MSSKQNITLHLNGIKACESREYEHALQLFTRITEPSAPILFNIGSCYLKLNQFAEALEMFLQCVAKDKYLVIGHFQLGVAQTLCGDVASATRSFKGAFAGLRDNSFIDYKQLNMSCKLYAAEINFNLGLAYLFFGDYDNARYYIGVSGGLPINNTRHANIPVAVDAIKNENWTYFGGDASHRLITLPANSFFGVSKAKQEGLQASTDFMPKAQVLAAANDDYSSVGFAGARKLQLNANATTSQAIQDVKRNGSAMGPPPSIPPPRLPKGTESPTRSSPVPNFERRPSPPNIRPPTNPLPKSMPKYVPPAPMSTLAAREGPPNKPLPGRISPAHSGTGVMSEWRNAMENVKTVPPRPRSPVAKFSPPPVRKPMGTPTQSVLLKCEFSLDVSDDMSYDELIAKVSEKLSQSASQMPFSLRRRTATFELEDTSKMTQVNISSSNNTWQTALSNMMKNRQSVPVMTLKESREPTRGNSSPKRPPSPNLASRGYMPSRQLPPGVRNNSRNAYDEYHELQLYDTPA